MKILAINGSHRGENGHTQVLLDLLGEGIRAAGAEFEIVTLAIHKINRCLACEKLHGQEQSFKRVMVTKAREYFA